MLIVFEGIDGVGKTTQLQMTKADLENAGLSVMVKRNLGGTPIGEALREAMLQPLPRPPMTDVYISAAIQEALTASLESERGKDTVILLDRSPLSLATYEVFGSGVDADTGWKFTDMGMRNLKPDLVLIYDLPPAVALQRLSQAGKQPDYFESKPADYFERVAEGYREAAKRYGAHVIDATPSQENVFASTIGLVRAALAAHASS